MSMTLEDYKTKVLKDATEVITTEADYYEADTFDQAFDQLQLNDSVTGNASGSYTCNTAQAAENLAELVWSEELEQLFAWYGYDHVPIERGPETVDVITRCLCLYELYPALEDIWHDAADEWERAAKILIDHGIDPTNARWLIEWMADEPLEWAERYAPYIQELRDENPAEWEREYPDDVVITDGGLTCPVVISATPIQW